MAWFHIPLKKQAAPGGESVGDSSSESITSHTATVGVSGDSGIFSSLACVAAAASGLRLRPFWLGRLRRGFFNITAWSFKASSDLKVLRFF